MTPTRKKQILEDLIHSYAGVVWATAGIAVFDMNRSEIAAAAFISAVILVGLVIFWLRLANRSRPRFHLRKRNR